MVRDIIEKNGRVNPNADLLKKLKSLIPGVIAKDGSIDADAIRYWAECAVGDPKLVTEERETFNFLGKDYARLLYALDTETVITPDEENNRKSENKNSENLYLSGDNLEVLKHLRHSYEGQVKCIYIDPPYNTGSDDFVYNDSFDFTEKDLKEKLGLDDDAQVEKIMNMRKRGSRSHAAWLTFMYPRLKLARDLLKDDGVIFISIDDNEQANLKILCDEILGEENFLSLLARRTKAGGGSASKHFAIEHDYVLAYAKRSEMTDAIFVPFDEKYAKRYALEDENGRYFWDTMERSCTATTPYIITAPDGTKLKGNWFRSQERFEEDLKKGEVKFLHKENGSWSVQFKQRMAEGKKVRSILGENEFKSNLEDLESLGLDDVFSFNKPVYLLDYLIKSIIREDAIILDFFSGSATTAHAVMQLNASEKNGCRKFIMVQLPENLDEIKKPNDTTKNAIKFLESIHKPHTLDQIGMERIRRAATKIKEEHPDCKCDFGFKHYIIQKPAEKSLETIKNFESNPNFGETTILKQFGVKTVLATWMVDDGHAFNANVEEIDLNGYTAYKVNDYLYLINVGIEDKHIKSLFKKYDEDKNFKPKHLVLFGYSFGMTTLDTLKTNAKNVDGIDIHTEIRY